MNPHSKAKGTQHLVLTTFLSSKVFQNRASQGGVALRQSRFLFRCTIIERETKSWVNTTQCLWATQ
jgi:hypothetical protein